MAAVERMTTGFCFAGELVFANVDIVLCEAQPPAITMKVAVIILLMIMFFHPCKCCSIVLCFVSFT